VTEIAFHFGAPDKLGYACRLLRKAVRLGNRITVYAEPAQLAQLDADLWTVSNVDFVTHCRFDAEDFLRERSHVLLTTGQHPVPATRPMVVNLSVSVPAAYDQYARMVEVVSIDEFDRAQARLRWKHYVQQGYALIKHDLKLKGA
jgi:DNA polymerase III subunit chi